MSCRGIKTTNGEDLKMKQAKKLSVQVLNLKQLNMGFAFLFILAGSLQQFLTVHFDTVGKPELGFKLLLTLYVAVFTTNIFVHKTINKLGEKRSILLSSACYLCAGFASCQQAESLLYASFAIMGFGCALIWNAQNLVLLNNSASDSLGKNAGAFTMYLWSGCFAGIVFFGLALKVYSFEQVAFIFTLLASASLLYFSKIKDSDLPLVKADSLSPVIKNSRYLLAAVASVKSYFLYGLAISFIPFVTSKEYENTLYVALVSLVFFMAQAFCSKPCGALIDRFGTNKLALAGAVTSLLGFSFLIFSLHWVALILSALFLGLSSAMLMPVTMILPKVIAPAKEQSAVIRLFMFAKYTGVLVAIALSTWGSIEDVLTVSIIACLVFIFISAVLKPFKKQNELTSKAGLFCVSKS